MEKLVSELRTLCRPLQLAVLVVLTSAPVSCGKDWSASRTMASVRPEGPDPGEPVQPPPHSGRIPEYYVAGVKYPQDYDWIRDPQYGTVDCTMFLMKDGDRILEFGVGYEYSISPDADMARCIGDHIYTDYSTSGETVVKKDGQELFRYPGREMMAGFIVRDGTGILTLGVPREGHGWTLRKNGAVVSSSDKGYPVSHLYLDGETAVFGWKIPENDLYGQEETYCIVRDGIPEAVASGTGDDGQETVDFLQHDNVLYILYLDKSGNAYLRADGEDRDLELPEGASLHSLEGLLSDSLAVYVFGEIETAAGELRNVLWKGSRIRQVFDADVAVSACYPDGDRLGATGYLRDDRTSPVYFLDGEYASLPSGYGFIPENSADFADGHFCLILMPLETGIPPVYVIDGKVHILDINGYLLSIGRLWTESPN